MRTVRFAMRLALITLSLCAASVFAASPAPPALASPAAGPTGVAPGDEQWDDRFGGFSSYYSAPAYVNDAVVFNGELYVAGRSPVLQQAGINAIARWDGRRWSAVGAWEGSAFVDRMVVHAGSLYVVGEFQSAGGVQARNIARWDGSAWSPLASGLDLIPNTQLWMAMASHGGDLYVAGAFSAAGGVPVNRIARWDGAAWSALGAGIRVTRSDQNPIVAALASTPHGLYVGGNFDRAGEIEAADLALWNDGAWSVVGGTDDFVLSLLWANDSLYVGGSFTQLGPIAARNIGRWDGAQWHALGAGGASMVTALAPSGASSIYVATATATANQSTLWRVDAANAWTQLGPPLARPVYGYAFIRALVPHAGDLYVGGGAAYSDSTTAVSHIMRFNDGRWSMLGEGFFTPSSGEFYASPQAATSEGVYVTTIYLKGAGGVLGTVLLWNGQDWQDRSIQPALPGMGVHALAAEGQTVYAGGTFGNNTGFVARRDGAGWTMLSTQFNGPVRALAWSNGRLYAGGTFSQVGGTAAANIARWDGAAWAGLGSGIAGSVRSLAVRGDDLYAGGQLWQAGGVQVSNIARWDGAAWHALGAGLNGDVHALQVAADGSVYAGGLFTQSGAQAVPRLARWHNGEWTALGGGVDGPVYAIALGPDGVYAGGQFGAAGGVAARNIARFDGAWSALGSGAGNPQGAVMGLLAVGGDVYVGGNFFVAGAKPATYFSIWHAQRGPNNAPQARADTAATVRGASIDIAVLGNDSDADYDALTVTGVTTPTHGSAQVLGATVRYTPANDFVGAVPFSYTISDGYGGSATAVVTVTINTIAPQARADTATTGRGASIDIAVLGNDSDADQDALTVTGVTTPTHGSAQVVGNAVRYTASSDFLGTVPFSYTISDGYGGSATAAVTVTISNIAPQPRVDTAATVRGASIDIAVLGNDSDADQDALTITGVTTPTHGSAQVVGNVVRYTPADDFVGAALFNYTISDGYGGTAIASVMVIISNVAPQALADTAATVRGASIDIAVLGNDSDADQDALTITGVTTPTHGSAQVVGNTVRYTPAGDFVGAVPFSYTISDGYGGTATATVTITVTPPLSRIFLPAVVR